MTYFRQSNSVAVLAGIAIAISSSTVLSNNITQPLPFYQNWSDLNLITVLDDWSSVPGIIGFTGSGLTNLVGVDPQTLIANDLAPDTAVFPAPFDITNPAISGVGELTIGRAVVLRGSVSSDAPYLLIHVNTQSHDNIKIKYTVKDADPTARDAVTPVALQYRVGNAGNFTNLPEAYVADATTPNEARKLTRVEAKLPVVAEDQPLVQLRILTTNANGSDEWVAIDDLEIAGDPQLSIVSNMPTHEGNETGAAACIHTPMYFTVSSDTPAPAGGIQFTYHTTNGTAEAEAAVSDNDFVGIADGIGLIPEDATQTQVIVNVNCDDTFESNEFFTVNLSATATQNYNIRVGEAFGNILNDDGPTIKLSDFTELEGKVGNKIFVFEIQLSEPAPDDVEIYLHTDGDTAIGNSDYTSIDEDLVTILAGKEYAKFEVTVYGDTDVEADETFNVIIEDASNINLADSELVATGTILNDDGPMFSITDVTGPEGSEFTFEIQLSEPAPQGDVSFFVHTEAGSATADSDYGSLGMWVVIEEGFDYIEVDVPVYADEEIESDETFTFRITDVFNANSVDSDLEATGTITNVD